jgi:ferric-dicitrate binding protein FerR (iron transport regulator)
MTRVHERRRIYRFLDGRLGERGIRKLERHLARCDVCRDHLERVRRMRNVLARMGEERPELDLERVRCGVDEAIDATVQHRPVSPWLRRAMVGAAAAALALLVVVLMESWPLHPDVDRPARTVTNGPVEIERTLLDASPSFGRLTLVGEQTRWRRPGTRWEHADLSTVIAGGTELSTGRRSVASVQVAPLSGVRLEPDSRVRFGTLVRDSLDVRLERGTVSVRVHGESGLRDVTVHAGRARASAESATLSMRRQGGATRVVVAEGRVRVTAPGGGQRLLVGPVVARVDERGIREVSKGEDDGSERSGVKWLRSLHFNLFETLAGERTVSLQPATADQEVDVVVDDMLVGRAPLSMLCRPGEGEATLAFEDGSRLRASFEVGASAHTTVKFETPAIDVEPAPPAAGAEPDHPPLPRADDGGDGGAEEPEPVHEGFLAPQIVKLVMSKQRGRLRDCYQEYLDGEPEVVEIKARIVFTVGTSGRVVEASARTNAADPDLSACLGGTMKNVVFPPPSGGTVQFAYPITFTPQ